jgi:hypothetical protein
VFITAVIAPFAARLYQHEQQLIHRSHRGSGHHHRRDCAHHVYRAEYGPDRGDHNAITPMLETIIVIVLILWLLGFSFHIGGGLIHALLVIALILFVIRLLS